MNKNNTMKWEDIYRIWQREIRKYPELNDLPCYRSVEFTEPQYGRCYYFNWIKKEEEETAIQEDLRILSSAWREVGENWSKGTTTTAGLLVGCETEEERAAVWICGFVLSLIRWKSNGNTTIRNAYSIEREACSVFAQKCGYWHTNSRDFFPEFYIPHELFWDSEELSVVTLVQLAAANAAMVVTHYIPVEYKRGRG